MKTDHIIRSSLVPTNPQSKLTNQDQLFLPNKVGETYLARVTAIDSGNLTLEFIHSNFKLSATTSLHLKRGQPLSLELTQTSPNYEFKVVNAEPDASTNALKVLLPKQAALQQDYQQWFKLLPTLTKNDAFSEQTQLALQQFFQSLPKHNDLSNPAVLRVLLLNSGLFHEKKGIDGSSANSDKRASSIKALLLSLMSQISVNKSTDDVSSLLKDFLGLTEGALSKIVLDQLISTSKDQVDQKQWVLTLPYLEEKTNKTIDIKIKQRKNNTSHQDIDNWSVLIRFCPSTLGQITCKLSHNQELLNAMFWCENDSTGQLFEDRLTLLQGQLQRAGLKLGHFTVSQGIPEQPFDFTSFDGQLVNETV